ncbi:MAG: hypothetical protein R3F30_06040 [Planctomycetota bacterium]
MLRAGVLTMTEGGSQLVVLGRQGRALLRQTSVPRHEGDHEVVILDGTRTKMRFDEGTDFGRIKAVDPAPLKPLEGDINAGFTWASGNTDRIQRGRDRLGHPGSRRTASARQPTGSPGTRTPCRRLPS